MRSVLAVETLFFGDEVRDPSALAPALEDVEVDQRELELAVRLIEELTAEWDPAAYADEYRQELLRMLAEKEPTARAPKAEAAGGRPPPVTELMAALKESVEASRQGKRRSG
jgi:DNA end-binding protein Ku